MGFIIFLMIGALCVAIWAFMSMDSGPKRLKTMAISMCVFFVSIGVLVIGEAFTSSPSSSGKDKETQPSYSYNEVKDIIIQDYWEDILN